MRCPWLGNEATTASSRLIVTGSFTQVRAKAELAICMAFSFETQAGGLGGTRTPDALLRTEALYPLSYKAAWVQFI